MFEAVVTVELGEANSCSGEDWSGRLLGLDDDEDIFLVFDGLNQDTSFVTNLLVLANFSFLVVFVNFSVALLTETGNELF